MKEIALEISICLLTMSLFTYSKVDHLIVDSALQTQYAISNAEESKLVKQFSQMQLPLFGPVFSNIYPTLQSVTGRYVEMSRASEFKGSGKPFIIIYPQAILENPYSNLYNKLIVYKDECLDT